MSTREERDLLLPWIEDLPAYVPGRPANAASGLVPVKLSSNENPYAPLPSVLEAAIATLQDANRYPDPQATELVHTLAGLCGVAPDNIAVGPGSVALLQQLAQVTVCLFHGQSPQHSQSPGDTSSSFVFGAHCSAAPL